MGPLSYMRSVFDRNVFMRRVTVFQVLYFRYYYYFYYFKGRSASSHIYRYMRTCPSNSLKLKHITEWSSW